MAAEMPLPSGHSTSGSPSERTQSDAERRLLECEEALRSTEAQFAQFREEMLGPIKYRDASIESLSWDELLGIAVRNLNMVLDLDRALRDLVNESRPWLVSGRRSPTPAWARARDLLERS